MSNILEAIEKRSSTRGYQSEKLTDAELDALVKAGLQAPTAADKQEIHITVVDGSNSVLAEIEAEKNVLAGIKAPAANFYYSAPTVLILSGDKAFPRSALDAGIAVDRRGTGTGQRYHRLHQGRHDGRKGGILCRSPEVSKGI